MVPWLSNKPEDQSGGPRTNLEVFGMKWVSNIVQKHENPLPPCHVRPNPAKVRGNRIVWSMPCPRTPLDLSHVVPGPMGPQKKGMPPPKKTKSKPFYKNWWIWEVVQVPGKHYLCGVIVWKIIIFDSSWDGTMAFKKNQWPIWRPENQFGGIWWWSEFPIFPKKHENRLPLCHVRQNPAKLRGNRFVWSMPCPRTPPDLPNTI